MTFNLPFSTKEHSDWEYLKRRILLDRSTSWWMTVNQSRNASACPAANPAMSHTGTGLCMNCLILKAEWYTSGQGNTIALGIWVWGHWKLLQSDALWSPVKKNTLHLLKEIIKICACVHLGNNGCFEICNMHNISTFVSIHLPLVQDSVLLEKKTVSIIFILTVSGVELQIKVYDFLASYIAWEL